KYATLKEINVFNKKIALAQNLNAIEAKKSYEEAFMPYKKGYCITLDERGKELTSIEFAKLIQDKNELSFFIGGAYGLREEFNQSLDFRLSLSKLTLAHQFVKTLLLEQIYRAFCINNNHPYHK
ncbi:23S rRNA (pseudouridine(1915)-N(3))-methyltransferase RlmH, partial [Campylobacter sp. CH185]